MAFIARSGFTGCRRFRIKQGIKIAAVGDDAGQLIKTRFRTGDCTVRSVRLVLGCHLGIKRDGLALGDHHAAAVGQGQNDLGAITGDDDFAFTDDITGFQPTQITRAVAGVGFTGNGRDFCNNSSLGHDDTPKWVGDTS